MRLNLEQKQEVVSQVAEVLAGSEAAILTEYRGLSVAQMAELRAEARSNGVFLRVVKNTLTRRAIEGTQYEPLGEHLRGPLAVAAASDPVAMAKVLSRFTRSHERLQIKVGVMEGKLLSPAEIDALAKLPSREELLARLIGTMQAPVTKFVQTLNEVPARFVRTVAAVRDSKQAA